MASHRRARTRQPRDPQTVLQDATILCIGRPNSRNRKRLIAARVAYAARVITAPPTLALDEAS